jgi:Cu+-exporting ATPase
MNLEVKSEKINDIRLDLYGMTCANCALRIEKGLKKLEQVEDARVNFARETVYIKLKNTLDLEKILQHIQSLGYEASKHSDSNPNLVLEIHQKELNNLKNKFFISLFFTLPLFYAMVGHFSFLNFLPLPRILMHPWLQFLLAFPIQFWIGFSFYLGAFRALKNISANMDVLVVLGTSAAFFYSLVQTILIGYSQKNLFFLDLESLEHIHFPALYYETSAVLITFILGGKWLETIAKGKSSDAIQKLLHLKPENARIKQKDDWVELPSEYLKQKDIVLIKAGEKVPADGKVREGISLIDESFLTGESIPVEKTLNSKVIGGTLNLTGALIVEIEKTGSETVLSKIIKIVEEAQNSKAPLQNIADKISSLFVPSIVIISFLDFILWYYFIDPNQFASALEKSISILVVACPCALGLATPISLLVGTSIAAGKGILFKNAEALESTANLDIIAFDKTGTLTEGRPYVVNFYSTADNDNYAIKLIASVENASEHPLAKAIIEFARSRSIELAEFQEISVKVGSGIDAKVEGHSIFIGNLRYMQSLDFKLPDLLIQKSKEWQENALTLVYSAIQKDNNLSFLIFGIEDKIKESSFEAIQELKKAGIELVLLTGDHEVNAKKIGNSLGIEQVHFNLSPSDKSKFISELRSKGNKVGMVGDGINDSPALASADIGIAMGNGTDIAIESAGVILVKGELGRLIDVIRTSKNTVSNIRQNFFWALGYNALCIPIAAMGFLSPWISGLAMAFSSISVVLNALRLSLKK